MGGSSLVHTTDQAQSECWAALASSSGRAGQPPLAGPMDGSGLGVRQMEAGDSRTQAAGQRGLPFLWDSEFEV